MAAHPRRGTAPGTAAGRGEVDCGPLGLPHGGWALAVAAWALLVQLVYLRGELLWGAPASPLFFGDALHYLAQARELAGKGASGLGAHLPFHPPVTAWLLVPLHHLLAEPEALFRAAKALMAVLSAATFGVTYLLLARRVAWALPLCLLMPLTFGELVLASGVNSEVPYRLLLALVLLLGTRWPLLGGALHALAALTRAEHLVALPLLLLAACLWRPQRRWALLTATSFAVLLLPHVWATHRQLARYNAQYAAELAEPLPEWVPVSFYGPLNFALAQTEDEIFFSRRNLPVTAGAADLDPTHPVHNEYVVHGYRVGLAEIARRPARFLRRLAAKLAFVANVAAPGWTWRNLPSGTRWSRPAVDLAYATDPLYLGASLLLVAAGCWGLRKRPGLLWPLLGLVAYALAFRLLFFPYLRGMMVVFPAVMVLWAAGVETLSRGATRRVLWILLVAVAAYHLATGWRVRNYALRGERDAAGTIFDDRAVEVEWIGFFADR